MPIRVLLYGQNMIAPFDGVDWDNLRERIRSKEIELHQQMRIISIDLENKIVAVGK